MTNSIKEGHILNKLEDLGKDLIHKIKAGEFDRSNKEIESFHNKPIFLIGLDNNINQNKRIIKVTRNFFSQYEVPIILLFNSDDSDNVKQKTDLFNQNNIKYFLIEKNDIDVHESPNITHTLKLLDLSENLNKCITDYYSDFAFNKGGETNKKYPQQIYALGSAKPVSLMLSLVFSNQNFIAIRGSFSSSKFLKILRKKLKESISEDLEFQRIALLETAQKFQFFYAPVGIDEVKSIERKINFIKNYSIIFNLLETSNRISILSGGRLGDVGRDPLIDSSILDAEEIVKKFKTELIQSSNCERIKIGNKEIEIDYNDIDVVHDEILIEKSVLEKSGFILAPTGMSGNLIYRTLVHLGAGNAFGALYTNVFLNTNRVLIDCSRVAEESELLGSFKIGLGFHALTVDYSKKDD